MSWTDERIELLRKLWTDGLSASQIAGELGQVTRNAVIGKVHRLGLAGRAKASASTVSRPARKAAPVVHRAGGGSVGGVMRPVMRGNTALKVMAAPQDEAYVAPLEQFDEDVVVPMSQRVTIMELREGLCKWPMGDPSSPDFRYCGAQGGSSGPYCAYHARSAYQPPADRRRHDRRVMSRI